MHNKYLGCTGTGMGVYSGAAGRQAYTASMLCYHMCVCGKKHACLLPTIAAGSRARQLPRQASVHRGLAAGVHG